MYSATLGPIEMVSFIHPEPANVSPRGPDNVQPMFKSTADVFRTRQALRDLTEAVRSNSPAIARLGTTDTERAAIDRIVASGGHIGHGDDRVYSQLLLSAAMPDDDFNGFAVATAILLMDRLQDGTGGDDLFWNWDAFREHYRLADPTMRAALMNGFRMAEASGKVNLESSPDRTDCLTRSPGEVMSLLTAAEQHRLADAIAENVSASDAGRMWREAVSGELSWPVIAAFRYLYERPASMAPADPTQVALIPWA